MGIRIKNNMDSAILEPSLYTIKAILILDNDGKRIITKYYDDSFATSKEQLLFEKNLFNKTHRANAEIIMLDGFTVVYRSNVDLFFYVVGSSNENALILVSVSNCFYDALNIMLKRNVEKRSLLDNLDGAFLSLDEVCDQGIILEVEPTAIAQRVSIRSDELPIGEQTVAQVLQTAKEQIKWSLLK